METAELEPEDILPLLDVDTADWPDVLPDAVDIAD